MDRKIGWVSGCWDEIELVYERAEKDPSAAELLSALEELALSELEKNCDMLEIGGLPATKELISQFSPQQKEILLYHLSAVGLLEFSAPLTQPQISVTLSSKIQRVLGCTVFSILNRLEKLDGTYNSFFPKATLELRVPLGGKKGLLQWEVLITRLYPWLSVSETSSHVLAENLSW